MAGSDGGSGGSGGMNKVAMLLAGGTVVGLITWFLWPGGDDGKPTPTPATTVAVATVPSGGSTVPTIPPGSSAPQPAGIDRKALTAGYPDGALLTITAYGMPARVSAIIEDEDNTVFTHGAIKQCVPDEQFPDPCVYYWLVKKGTPATITAGDSRAGYWPSLESVAGAGCDIKGDGVDHTCTITLSADADIVATFYGGESPGLAHYVYPVCPTNRGPSSPAWASRCP